MLKKLIKKLKNMLKKQLEIIVFIIFLTCNDQQGNLHEQQQNGFYTIGEVVPINN